MLFHIDVVPYSSLSVPEVKQIIAFLAERDASRPPKAEQIAWCAALTAELREMGLMDTLMRVVSRSSAPYANNAICVKSQGTNQAQVLELVDGDVRKGGLPFDFLDHIWFVFNVGPMDINGLTDEDWILARLSDSHGLLIEG